MDTIHEHNFNRIARAIEYLSVHFKEQPDLQLVAEKVNLSPFHFQRIFTDWAGISPKKFIQFTTVEYAKEVLKKGKESLLNTALETGLSGSSRLHDLFIGIEGMTPAEYRNGGESLTIRHSFSECLFGHILIASTSKGICHISFFENHKQALNELKDTFPNALHIEENVDLHQQAVHIFHHLNTAGEQVKLHLRASPFQLKVWNALLKIPEGHLASYGNIAEFVKQPNASRAVGTAIGQNPVAYLIPCHRIIQQSGAFGQYRWGSQRKTAMIGWEVSGNSNL